MNFTLNRTKQYSHLVDFSQILLIRPKKALNTEIAMVNTSLSEPEQITRFRMVADEWSPLTGELSASLKLRRKVIESKYMELLEDIYKKQS